MRLCGFNVWNGLYWMELLVIAPMTLLLTLRTLHLAYVFGFASAYKFIFTGFNFGLNQESYPIFFVSNGTKKSRSQLGLNQRLSG